MTQATKSSTSTKTSTTTNKSEKEKVLPKADSQITLGNGRDQKVPKKYENCASLTAVLKAMTKDGFTRGEMAKILGLKYQQVRGQLVQSAK